VKLLALAISIFLAGCGSDRSAPNYSPGETIEVAGHGRRCFLYVTHSNFTGSAGSGLMMGNGETSTLLWCEDLPK
jgi:hypothetical protein